MWLWPQKIDGLYISMQFKQANMKQIELLCRKKLGSLISNEHDKNIKELEKKYEYAKKRITQILL